jgi:hypothetical protein
LWFGNVDCQAHTLYGIVPFFSLKFFSPAIREGDCWFILPVSASTQKFEPETSGTAISAFSGSSGAGDLMIFSTFPCKVVLGFPLRDVSEFVSLMVASLCETISLARKCLATSERVN